jgi:4,5-DOPA dioxygenase extradiol
MVFASGNIVHNLRRLQWNRPDAAFDWAERFDEAAARQLAEAPGDILRLAEHPDYPEAVPTPDHFIPLLYLAGLAAAEGAALDPLVRGYAMGSISMSCYGLGTEAGLGQGAAGGAATIPEGVPAEQTNI